MFAEIRTNTGFFTSTVLLDALQQAITSSFSGFNVIENTGSTEHGWSVVSRTASYLVVRCPWLNKPGYKYVMFHGATNTVSIDVGDDWDSNAQLVTLRGVSARSSTSANHVASPYLNYISILKISIMPNHFLINGNGVHASMTSYRNTFGVIECANMQENMCSMVLCLNSETFKIREYGLRAEVYQFGASEFYDFESGKAPAYLSNSAGQTLIKEVGFVVPSTLTPLRSNCLYLAPISVTGVTGEDVIIAGNTYSVFLQTNQTAPATGHVLLRRKE